MVMIFTTKSSNGNKNGKLSVSIATCSVSSMKVHFALNLTENGTPDDVATASILEPMGILKFLMSIIL